MKARASNFLQIDSVQQLIKYSTQISEFEERFILGGGSNLLFIDDYKGLVIYPQLRGIRLIEENEQEVTLNVAASEIWHEFVQYCLNNSLFGLENLALIPGTVGAAPVQNIGAYGVEVEQFISKVECFDLKEQCLIELSHKECEFEYRDSLIKRSGQGRYLVTSVEMKLSKKAHPVLSYQPLKNFFEGQLQVAPKQVFDQVCQLRNQKLPNPNDLPNAGSFFKNPIVDGEEYRRLKEKYPELVGYPVASSSTGQYKLAAGWLIERAGFKGKVYGRIGVHKNQALVLVNYSDSNGANIWKLAETIMEQIFHQFNVELEPEVRVLGG